MQPMKDKTFQMRASEDWLRDLDNWRRKQEDIPGRAESIRRLVALGIDAEPVIADMLSFLERTGTDGDRETEATMDRLRAMLGR